MVLRIAVSPLVAHCCIREYFIQWAQQNNMLFQFYFNIPYILSCHYQIDTKCAKPENCIWPSHTTERDRQLNIQRVKKIGCETVRTRQNKIPTVNLWCPPSQTQNIAFNLQFHSTVCSGGLLWIAYAFTSAPVLRWVGPLMLCHDMTEHHLTLHDINYLWTRSPPPTVQIFIG